jgi:SAM-dependent methyltransferase
MAHESQRNFTIQVKNRFPDYFRGKRVLDCGSLDVNGSNRFLFEQCDYVGIDIVPGKNVDVVTLIHEHNAESESYDVIVSTEAFEHDKYWELSLKNIVRILKNNGMLLFTCATTGRSPHFFGPKEWGSYYKNLREEDVRSAIDVDTVFREYEFRVASGQGDLYFWGIKR